MTQPLEMMESVEFARILYENFVLIIMALLDVVNAKLN
jgi:hypothetical protein